MTLVLTATPAVAQGACEGLPADAAEQAATGRFRDTTLAFIGIVDAFTADGTRVRVEYVLRGGPVRGDIHVQDHEAPEIAVEFQPGDRYFVAAVQLRDGSLTTSLCKGTRRILDQEDLDNLLEIAGNPPPFETEPIGLRPVLVILAVVISVVGAWYLVGRRDRSGRTRPKS